MNSEFGVKSEYIFDSLCTSDDRSRHFDIDPSRSYIGASEEKGEASKEGVREVGGGKVDGKRGGNMNQALWCGLAATR